MTLLDILYGQPAPIDGRFVKRTQPLGPWPAPASPEKREAQRLRAIAGAAKRRNQGSKND